MSEKLSRFGRISSKQDFQKRTLELLRQERETDCRWFYISFAEPNNFLGGVIVKAHGVVDCGITTHACGINPGGELWSFEIPSDMPIPSQEYRWKLLSKDEVLAVWPDAKSLKEFQQEEAI